MPLMESLKKMFSRSSCGCTGNKTRKRSGQSKRSKGKSRRIRGGYKPLFNSSSANSPLPTLSKKHHSKKGKKSRSPEFLNQ